MLAVQDRGIGEGYSHYDEDRSLGGNLVLDTQSMGETRMESAQGL